jgi:hypothetical protein
VLREKSASDQPSLEDLHGSSTPSRPQPAFVPIPRLELSEQIPCYV